LLCAAIVATVLGAAVPADAQSGDLELLSRAADILRSQSLPVDAAQLEMLMTMLRQGRLAGMDVSSYRAMAPDMIKAAAAKLKQMNRDSAAAELEALANGFLRSR
jgi:hypothetical protein